MPRAGLLAPVIWLACAGLVWANSEAPVAEGGGQTAVTAAPTVPTAFDAAVAAYRAGDVGAAFAQFLILARAEMPQAQFNLALLYRQGEGVPQNRREALYWAWRARIGGVAQAGALVSDLLADVSADQRDRLVAVLAKAEASHLGFCGAPFLRTIDWSELIRHRVTVVSARVPLPVTSRTPYVNTIPADRQAAFPGEPAIAGCSTTAASARPSHHWANRREA